MRNRWRSQSLVSSYRQLRPIHSSAPPLPVVVQATETRFTRVTAILTLIATSVLALAALVAGWEYNRQQDKQQAAILEQQKRLANEQASQNLNTWLISTQKKCVDLALDLYGVARSGAKDKLVVGLMREFVKLDTECRKVDQPLPKELVDYFASLKDSKDPAVARAARGLAVLIRANDAQARPGNIARKDVLDLATAANDVRAWIAGARDRAYPRENIKRDPVTGTQAGISLLQAAVLQGHNIARAERGVPPLRWSRTLAEHAQGFANELARSGKIYHSPGDQRPGEGENLWMGTRGAFAYEEMVSSWLAEVALFKPGLMPDVSTTGRWAEVGHYTQAIWRSTTEIGCALASNDDSDFLVCRYAPPGNVIGRDPIVG